MARIVLIVRELRPLTGPNIRQRYDACLENGEVIVTSHQPLLEASRVLLARGTIVEDDILVLRHEGSTTEALSGRAGDLAKLAIAEPDRPRKGTYPRFVRYRPRHRT